MTAQTRLAASSFAPDTELAEFMAGLGEEGAVVSFVGLVRPRGADGEPLERLFLDHHPRLTERSLVEIAEAALARFEVGAVRVVHRCGEMRPGEPIVFAAAASRHRRAAFEAADYLMDRLKTDAMFWKREDGTAGSIWVEPTDDDHAGRARWETTCRE